MPSRSYELAQLRNSLKPFRLHFFPRLGSTNDHAIELRRCRALFAPAVVLTANQVKGRGRGTNTWWSAPGNIAATFVLPIEEHLHPHQVPLIAGLAVRDAVARLSGVDDIQIKWPNDLLYENFKVAGLLCERVDKVDLIGVGINVNFAAREIPRSLRDRIVSLQMITGRELDRAELIADIAHELRRLTSRPDEPLFSEVLKRYDRHHALRGRRVRVVNVPGEPNNVSGTCAGLDSMGRLLVRTGAGVSRVIAGHIVLE